METTIKKITATLSGSPFGSGPTAAELFSRLFPSLPGEGIYRLLLSEEGVAYYQEEAQLGFPSWSSEVSQSVQLTGSEIMFLLGCGIHHAYYMFSAETGDLVDVVPDEKPSSRFWGDGEADIEFRRRRLFRAAERALNPPAPPARPEEVEPPRRRRIIHKGGRVHLRGEPCPICG